MIRSLFFLGYALFFVLCSQAQTIVDARLAAQELVYEGYVQDQRSLWARGLSQLRALHNQSPTDEPTRYQLALTAYGLIGMDQNKGEGSSSDLLSRIEEAQNWLKPLEGSAFLSAAVQAMQGGLLAMRIEEEPWRAIGLARRSRQLLEQAVQDNPRQAAAWIELGNLRYHAPSLFGGDMEKAVQCFQRAVDLIEAKPAISRRNWLYLHALAWLGQSQAALEQWDAAQSTYEHALQVEPDFRLVRSELLPVVQAKLANVHR